MIPFNPYVLVGGISALVIAFALGVYKGYSYEHEKFMAYKHEVKLVADRQEQANLNVKKQSALVNKGIQNEYEARINATRNYFASGLRIQPSSGPVPAVPTAARSADAEAADSIFARQCTETTIQLTSLQSWVNEQIGIR